MASKEQKSPTELKRPGKSVGSVDDQAVEAASVLSHNSSVSVSAMHQKPKVIMNGNLLKWTNFVHGFKQRFFILYDNGNFAYYSSPADRQCRGMIDMANAFIDADAASSTRFTVRNAQSSRLGNFSLNAQSSSEREKWIQALRMARAHKVTALEDDDVFDEQLLDGKPVTAAAMNGIEINPALMEHQLQLNRALKDIKSCLEMLNKTGDNLHSALTDLEHQLVNSGEERRAQERLKTISNHSCIFRMSANAIREACLKFYTDADEYNKKCTLVLQREVQQRVNLQNQMQELARQHDLLEREAMRRQGSLAEAPAACFPTEREKTLSIVSDSEDDATVFHDANESFTGISAYASEDRLDDDFDKQMHRSPSEDVLAQRTKEGGDIDDEDEVANEKAHSRMSTKYLNAKIVTREGSKQEPSSGQTTPTRSTRPSISVLETEESAIENSTSSLAGKTRRTTITEKPNYPLSLWSIMRNCIGKDLSKIPMPVNFNEPISFLQRITEDLEYASTLLESAREATSSLEQMTYVAAFAVSSYSTTSNNRTTKPFNPLLGETFECDRWDDLGWRSLCEQVSHHPPVAAHHCEGKGWTMYQEFAIASKFRGKYLSVVPTGIAHLKFEDGNHYTWKRVTTTIHNIIVGKLWIDHHGEMVIRNHTTDERCTIKFTPYSYFSKEPPRKVTGVVSDKNDKPKFMLNGMWDTHLDCLKILESSRPNVVETAAPRRIWEKNELPDNAEKMYFMTALALQLNEPETGVASTDSRLRPDQRLMEDARWDEAQREKLRLEEKQRRVRRQREKDEELAQQEGRLYEEYKPVWFHRQTDPIDNVALHTYNGNYWASKLKNDWPEMPDIYGPSDD